MPFSTDTPTPTPGPFGIFDDFSAPDGGRWSPLQQSARREGALAMGPFTAFSRAVNSEYVLCVACGQAPFYRTAVDVTFLERQADRYFGIFAPIFPDGNDADHMYFLGASPLQAARVVEYNTADPSHWPLYDKPNSHVRASTLPNRLEIQVKPAAGEDKADVFFYVNGSLIYAPYALDAAPPGRGTRYGLPLYEGSL